MGVNTRVDLTIDVKKERKKLILNHLEKNDSLYTDKVCQYINDADICSIKIEVEQDQSTKLLLLNAMSYKLLNEAIMVLGYEIEGIENISNTKNNQANNNVQSRTVNVVH